MTNSKRAIVLRLDESVVNRIDNVRHTLRMDRTMWLRKAVARNLAYNIQHELRIPRDADQRSELMSISIPK